MSTSHLFGINVPNRGPCYVKNVRIILEAVPSPAVGLVIVEGIAFGFFIATESAAIGTVMALLVSTLIYRELPSGKL